MAEKSLLMQAPFFLNRADKLINLTGHIAVTVFDFS
jgi:hypothetical protein